MSKNKLPLHDLVRWIVDEMNERYILQNNVIKFHQPLDEQAELFEQNNGQTGAWFSRPVQTSVRKRIIIALKQNFESIIKICRKDIYPSIKNYVERLHRIGGVVEAEPIEKLGYVEGMCFISPTGKIDFYVGTDVGMDDRIQAQSYFAPQTMIPTRALDGATCAMGTFLHEKWKLIGYLTVRFQAFWDGLDNIPRLWGISIQCGHTPQFGALGTGALAMNTLPYKPNYVIPTPVPEFIVPEGMGSKFSREKYILYVPWTCHEGLKGTRDDIFFKFCSMRGISFDKQDKTGILFFLSDSLLSGRLSFISVATSRFRALEQAINTITYITEQFGKLSQGIDYYDGLSSLLLNLKKIYKAEEKLVGPLG